MPVAPRQPARRRDAVLSIVVVAVALGLLLSHGVGRDVFARFTPFGATLANVGRPGRDGYNLAGFRDAGAIRVAVVSSNSSVTLSGVATLLRAAIVPDVPIVALAPDGARSDLDAADAIMLGTDVPHDVVAHVVRAHRNHAVIIVVRPGAPAGGGTTGVPAAPGGDDGPDVPDGVFDVVADSPHPPAPGGPGLAPPVLATPAWLAGGLLRDGVDCAALPPPGAPHDYPLVAWCAAARAMLVGAHVRALRRGAPPAPLPGRRAFFITYASSSPGYDRARARIAAEARATGLFHEVLALNSSALDPAFVDAHANVMRTQWGDGYCRLWKAHVVRRAMRERTAHGDVLLWVDVGCHIVAPPARYLDITAKEGTLGFQLTHLERKYTKGIVFTALDVDAAAFGATTQIMSGVVGIRHDPLGLHLLATWEHFNADARLCSDDPVPGAPNAPDFVAHRHDQSLWSVLLKKHGALGGVIPDETWPAESAPLIGATRWRDKR